MGFGLSKRSILAIAVVVIVAGCSLGYIAHINGDSLDFSRTDAKIVVSGSMDGEPRDYPISTIPTGSMVVIHKVPSDSQSFYSSLKVGDVLTFDYIHPVSKESMVVTHRIISISESSGVYTYTLKGDSIADDPTNGSVQTVTSDSGDVIGKVVGVSHWLGVLAVFLSTWTGKFCLVLIPCVILIVSEVRNIVRILRNKDGEDVPAEPMDASAEGPADASIDGPAEEPVGDRISEVHPDTVPEFEVPESGGPVFITAEERRAARGGRIE